MGDLSAHFSTREFTCHCCGHAIVSGRLVQGLEQLRQLAARPILVHDGYRCRAHNEEVGGTANSEHTRGTAADIEIPGMSLQQMYELALGVPQFSGGGIGVYDGGFLHLDVRSHSARWARVRGQYVGIHQLVREPLVFAKAAAASHSG